MALLLLLLLLLLLTVVEGLVEAEPAWTVEALLLQVEAHTNTIIQVALS